MERRNLCERFTHRFSRLHARRKFLGPATVARVILLAVRLPEIQVGLAAPHNFRAVSAYADTARKHENSCFVAIGATNQEGQEYESRR